MKNNNYSLFSAIDTLASAYYDMTNTVADIVGTILERGLASYNITYTSDLQIFKNIGGYGTLAYNVNDKNFLACLASVVDELQETLSAALLLNPYNVQIVTYKVKSESVEFYIQMDVGRKIKYKFKNLK